MDFLRDDLDENALLEYALDLAEILANRDSKNMVVLFDEFQDASRVAGHSDIYKRMRSHFQNHKSVSYLFLGSKEGMMNSLFGNRREAFYRFAVVLPIPPIPEDSWRMYISQKFKEQHIKADEKVIRKSCKRQAATPRTRCLSARRFTMLCLKQEKNRDAGICPTWVRPRLVNTGSGLR